MKTEDYYKYEVLDVIAELGRVTCGTSDPLPDTSDKAQWLSMRLAAWSPNERTFDKLVRQLAHCAVSDYAVRHIK